MSNVLSNAYSVEVACRRAEPCDYVVYAPEVKPSDPPMSSEGYIDPTWRRGFGLPVMQLRAYSSQLSKEEGKIRTVPTPRLASHYIPHRIDTRSGSSGDVDMVLRTGAAFMNGHNLLYLPKLDEGRIGVLGQLAAEEAIDWLPSPSLAVFMGQLPDLSAQSAKV